jgi:hypothetical protein
MSFLMLNKTAAPSTPAAGKAAAYFDTADSKMKVITETGEIDSLSATGLRDANVITNGEFDYAQRQVPTTLTTYSSVGGRVYSADRWWLSNENASTQFQQVDTMTTPETGLQARQYGKFKKITATGKCAIGQVVEANDMAHLRGLTVRFSCKMRYTVAASMTVRLGIVALGSGGTVDTVPSGAAGYISAWGGAGTDPTLTAGANLTYIIPGLVEGGTLVGSGMTCVLTANWVRYSATFLIPSTCKNIIPTIWSNGQLTTNDELNISEIGLYAGQETRDWYPRSQSLQLDRCKRFYQKTFAPLVAPAQTAGVIGALRGMVAIAAAVATSSTMQWKFSVQLRVAPVTTTFYNPSAANAFMRNVPAATDATATAAASPSADGIDINCTGLAAWTVGQEIKVHCTVDAEI